MPAEQRELAERAGTTQSAIARLETGRSTPSFDTVLRLVRLCGLDLDVMLVERDESDWAQAQRLTCAELADERLRRMERRRPADAASCVRARARGA